MGVIYCATNKINGKKYVGQTIGKLSQRKRAHKSAAIKGVNHPFYAAIRKYGFKSFEWEVLKELEDDDDLDLYEIRFVKSERSLYPNGYNLTEGGFGCRHSEETKQKIRDMWKDPLYRKKTIAARNSPEAIRKLKESLKEAKDRIYSPEANRKRAEKQKGRMISQKTIDKIVATRKARDNYGHTEKTKAKLSETIKNSEAHRTAVNTDDFKQKVRETHTGKVNSEETRKKMSEAMKALNRKLTDEQKKHLSELQKGKTFEERFGEERAAEIKRKQSEALKSRDPKIRRKAALKSSQSQKGRVFTEEHRRKMSEAGKKRAKEKPMTEETKTKLRNASIDAACRKRAQKMIDSGRKFDLSAIFRGDMN